MRVHADAVVRWLKWLRADRRWFAETLFQGVVVKLMYRGSRVSQAIDMSDRALDDFRGL